MTRTTYASAALATAFAIMSAPQLASAEPSPLGIWLDHSGRGAVEIKPCGSALCGFVVAVSNENDAKGCGKQIIGGAKAAASGIWSGGWIYSPERRKTYDVELQPLDNGTLRVVGFAGIKLFSRTMIWKPAPADLALCGSDKNMVASTGSPNAIKTAATAAVATAKTGLEPTTSVANIMPPRPVPASRPLTSAHEAKTEPTTPDDASDQAPVPQTEPSADNVPATEPAAEDDTVDAGPPTTREGGLDLGGLQLDKFLTLTKSGKCKIDLPWVKLTVNCNE